MWFNEASIPRYETISGTLPQFFLQMDSFAGLIKRTSQLMFSDTAITDCHSDTSFPAQSTLGVDILSVGSETRGPRGLNRSPEYTGQKSNI